MPGTSTRGSWEDETFEVDVTSGPRSRHGDFIALVGPETGSRIGTSYVAVCRPMSDIVPDGTPSVGSNEDLVAICRLRVDRDVPERTVRLDQTIRHAVGIPHMPAGEHVRLAPVHVSTRVRVHEYFASLFGRQFVIGRASTGMMATAEKGVVQVGNETLELLGAASGSRLRFHGLQQRDVGREYDLFVVSIPVLGLDPEVVEERTGRLDTDVANGNPYFMDPRALFRFADQHVQLDDIPAVWMDAAVRDLVGIPAPLYPVRVRRSTLSSIATDFRNTGLFVVFAVAALTGLFGVEDGIVTGLAAIAVSLFFALMIIAWGLRQQVAQPSRRRR